MNHIRQGYYLPVEIQIRTVFEDAWGEVDHKYGYSSKKGKKTNAIIKNPDNINRHLDILKKFSDASGEYADAIHLEVLSDNKAKTEEESVKSIGSDKETLNNFKASGIIEEKINKYSKARKVRETGLSKQNESKEEACQFLEDASRIFKELSEISAPDSVAPNDLFYYYTSMNNAFCLLSMGRTDKAKEALSIYEDLELNFPNYPLIKMRIAQTYGKIRNTESALSKCHEAYTLYEEIKENGFTPSKELPEADYNYIKQYLPKIYGYNLWLKAEDIIVSNTATAVAKIDTPG